jgi:predicted nucleotidyltransferase
MIRSLLETACGDASLADRLRCVAAATPGLGLLVLHGSRARGEAHDRSDWDFAYLAGGDFDQSALGTELVRAIGVERVDLANLVRASALLRYRCARDGIVVFAAAPDAFDRFRLEALAFWLDMAPILRSEYERRLETLE